MGHLPVIDRVQLVHIFNVNVVYLLSTHQNMLPIHQNYDACLQGKRAYRFYLKNHFNRKYEVNNRWDGIRTMQNI